MSDGVSFGLPRAFVIKQFKMFLITSVGAIAMVIASGKIKTVQSGLLVAIGLLLVDGIGYAVLASFKHVSLSERGIRGRSKMGRDISLLWSDPVTLSQTVSSKLPGLSIARAGESGLVFPLAVTQSEGFMKTLREYAPDGHALLAEIEKRQAAGK